MGTSPHPPPPPHPSQQPRTSPVSALGSRCISVTGMWEAPAAGLRHRQAAGLLTDLELVKPRVSPSLAAWSHMLVLSRGWRTEAWVSTGQRGSEQLRGRATWGPEGRKGQPSRAGGRGRHRPGSSQGPPLLLPLTYVLTCPSLWCLRFP